MYEYFTDDNIAEPMLWRANDKSVEYLTFDLTWERSAFSNLDEMLSVAKDGFTKQCTEVRAIELIEMYST